MLAKGIIRLAYTLTFVDAIACDSHVSGEAVLASDGISGAERPPEVHPFCLGSVSFASRS